MCFVNSVCANQSVLCAAYFYHCRRDWRVVHCHVIQKNQLKHILIIDDSADQRLLLKILLEAKGYTTECTTNGKEALRLLREKKFMPETILLDMNMEVMGGFEFRQLQRADPLLKDIPVIVVSGEDDINSLSVKMNSEVVQKPLKISTLLAALGRSSRPH